MLVEFLTSRKRFLLYLPANFKNVQCILFTCDPFNDAVCNQDQQRWFAGPLLNDQLQRMWKEGVVAYFNIVTCLGFAWLIRRGLDLMIEFIGPLYNWLQQFTNHYLTHCQLLPTGHSTGTILTSNWTELHYSVVLTCTPLYSYVLLNVSSYNSLALTSRKTPSSVVKNACLLFRYLAMDVLLFLRA
jgi:hypothetical protein